MTQSGCGWQFRLASYLALAGAIIAFSGDGAFAQSNIVPDDTLGDESSIVTPININGLPSDEIEGGAQRGANLFHSFSEFNVNSGRGAYFANPAGIENIFSRVTGANPSEILGTLGVSGDANLFLINPNGIIFGENGRLDVGGSFVGSTADSVVFDNDFEFSASNPQAPPLLTVNVPIGLQFGSNPGNIVNRSVNGLEVQPENTLALVGGEIDIEGGVLLAPDGRIELGSAAGNNQVSLVSTNIGYNLDYDKVEIFQDINLRKAALVDTSGEGGGSIQVQGKNITLADKTSMFADTLGEQNGSGVFIQAERLTLKDDSLVTADVLGSGQGGNVAIVTGQLHIADGGGLSASTFNEGNAGKVSIRAWNSVLFDGESKEGRGG